ncbi:hypothetical protein PMAYCL1PPCAC_04769, partial [Pristionchus mayeri]
ENTTTNCSSRSIYRILFCFLLMPFYVKIYMPLVLLYLPCIAFLLLPFVPGHGLSSPGWLLSLFYSIYPIVDPLVMIIFIRDYRQGLLNLLRRAVLLRSAEDSTQVVTNSRIEEKNNNKITTSTQRNWQ